MASAWGVAWGKAWGNAWGVITPEPPDPDPQPALTGGGGAYHQPEPFYPSDFAAETLSRNNVAIILLTL
jgi:hypothetical protein